MELNWTGLFTRLKETMIIRQWNWIGLDFMIDIDFKSHRWLCHSSFRVVSLHFCLFFLLYWYAFLNVQSINQSINQSLMFNFLRRLVQLVLTGFFFISCLFVFAVLSIYVLCIPLFAPHSYRRSVLCLLSFRRFVFIYSHCFRLTKQLSNKQWRWLLGQSLNYMAIWVRSKERDIWQFTSCFQKVPDTVIQSQTWSITYWNIVPIKSALRCIKGVWKKSKREKSLCKRVCVRERDWQMGRERERERETDRLTRQTDSFCV